MAVWQHDYYFIPQSRLEEQYGKIPETLSWEDYDGGNWWQGISFPADQEMEAILPLADNQWSETIRIWGHDRGDRISILDEEDGSCPDSVEVRIDLLREFPDVRRFVQTLVELARKHSWVFYTMDERILLPDYEALAADLAASGAQHFSNDPEGYLDTKRP